MPPISLAFLTAAGLVLAPQTTCWVEVREPGKPDHRWMMQPQERTTIPVGASVKMELMWPVVHPAECQLPPTIVHRPSGYLIYNPSYVGLTWSIDSVGGADVNLDGDNGTDADIEAFFQALAGQGLHTESADWNGDGDVGTDADIEAFYRSLAGRLTQ